MNRLILAAAAVVSVFTVNAETKVGIIGAGMIGKLVIGKLKEYRLDVERWKRRVDAVNAKDFLNSFYDAVNMILEQREGSSGTWQLKIVSTRDRYFSFWGSENNLQRWSVVVNMYGESTSTVSISVSMPAIMSVSMRSPTMTVSLVRCAQLSSG